MPSIIKRKCNHCGKEYYGQGTKYCSVRCAQLAGRLDPSKSIRESSLSQRRYYKIDPHSPLLRMGIIHLIKSKERSIGELAEKFGVREKIIHNVIHSLADSGYTLQTDGDYVKLSGEIPEYKPFRISPKQLWGRKMTFGLVSDSHLGSYQERLDVLEAAYDEFKKLKITTVYHAGNIVEGECHFNKYDIRVHGIADQTLYCLDHYPQRAGIMTYYITADDHEGWWFQREGIDFGRYLYLEAQERGRKDLVHLGYQEIDIELMAKRGKSIMRLTHPGGGTSYAISYALQKIVESFQGGEKPQILLSGHYHKAGYFYPREVHSVLCACTCDQSRFMRKKKIQAHLGYFIITVKQADTGEIIGFEATFRPFYDRKFYVKKRI